MKKQKEKEGFVFINKHKLRACEVWNEDGEFYLNLNDVKKLIEIVLEEKNMKTLFDYNTKKDLLEELKKKHLALPEIDGGYYPDDLAEKRKELDNLMLKYIWKWSDEVYRTKKECEQKQ